MGRKGNRRVSRRNLGKKKKNRVKKKPTTGDRFEARMQMWFDDYFEKHGIPGKSYVLPYNTKNPQHIDLLIDSKIMGYIGIECKSIFEDALKNGKLYFDQIAHVNAAGVHQFERQHEFLEDAGRYGILAFEMRCMDRIFLLPHRFAYDKLMSGAECLTISEVVRHSFMIEPNRRLSGDLVSFVRNKCW